MSPTDRLLPRYAAEPPQEPLPYGRWADRLRTEFLSAAGRVDAEGEDPGEPGEVLFYPERGWHGRTFVPITCATSTGLELYGYVRYRPGADGEPDELHSQADFTAETAAEHPEWKIDLCDEVIGIWRGERGAQAAMTLVWGRALTDGAGVASAELADVEVDQCPVMDGRFTLIAPDDYRGDFLEIKLFSDKGVQLARESLYEE